MSHLNETKTNSSLSTLNPSPMDVQIAGWALVLPATMSLILYYFCMKAMWKLKNQYGLFGFLISFSFCDIGILLVCLYYGVSILFQYTIINGWVILVLPDFIWHPLIYHYSMLAASRFAGIVWPHFAQIWFTQKRIAAICGSVWMIGILQFAVILLQKVDSSFIMIDSFSFSFPSKN